MPDTTAAADASHPVDVHAAGAPPTGLGTLAVGVVAIAALYFGREVFVPMALAVLLSFALGPPVLVLRRWHSNRVLAVIVVVVLAFSVILGIGGLIGSQVAHLAENLPRYQTNITEKVRSLRYTMTGSGVVGRAATTLSDLGSEIAQPEGKTASPAANRPAVLLPGIQHQQPVPVEIRSSGSTPVELILQIAGPLLQPVATAGIVIVFVIFFLLQRQDLRDRFIRLAGARDLRRTTAAMDDAARRMSRYLLMQSAINASVGVLVGTGLWFIGVPNPALWGILTMLLRFVPYIGPIIAAAFPAALAVAVDPGWATMFWVAGLFLAVQLVAGFVIEPWLYGHSTGLSGIAVLVAAAFWTLLWGPVGLLLSTPLTMCLVVLGRHVEHLQFFEVLLGDQPPLAPEESFYQHMLADDPDEAAHRAEAFLKDKPLSTYYDEVAIRGLALAQLDVNRGALDHARRVRIKEAVDWVIDDLSDHADAPAQTFEEGATELAALAAGSRARLAGDDGVVHRRSRLARPGGGGNVGPASGKARDRRPRRAVRGGFGGEPAAPRRGRRTDSVSFLFGTGQLRQRALPGTAFTAPAAAGNDRRRVLDVDGAGDRGEGCACGHARRSRRHLAAAGGRTGRRRRKGGCERRFLG